MFSYDLSELYLDLLDEVRNGPYGFVYSRDVASRGNSFMNVIYNNIDYSYYLDDYYQDDDDDSGSDDYYWERRSKFAYT